MNNETIIKLPKQVEEITSQLDSIEQQKADKSQTLTSLSQKRNTTTLIELSDLSQSVKTAMTGGSIAVVGLNAVNDENIVRKTITTEKIKSFQVGKNIFNLDDVKIDTVIDFNTGLEKIGVGYYCSLYIPIESGIKYTIKYVDQITFFDSNKTFIAGQSLASGNNAVPYTFTTPSTARYLRFYTQNSKLGINQLELGDTSTTFEKYKQTIKHLDLYDTVSDVKLKNDIVYNSLTDWGYSNYYHFKGISTSATTAFTVEFIVDLIEFSSLNGKMLNINYDFYNTSSNITQIYATTFLNNNPNPNQFSGGTSTDGTKLTNVLNKITTYSSSIGAYNSTYRYAHIYLRLTTTTQLESELYYGGVKITLDGNDLTSKITHIGTHNVQLGAVLNNDSFPLLNCVTENDVETLISKMANSNRFFGKKINVLGDSITDTGHTASTKKWHQLLAEEMNLSVGMYGVAGSTISNPTNGSNPICVRYANMNDDADLVIVFAGTNDRGFSQALKGTMFESDGKTPTKDVTTFYGAVNTLLEGLINKYINRGTTIMFATPIPRAENPKSINGTSGMTLRDYCDVIVECCKYYSIPVLDLYNTSRLPLFIDSIKTKYAPDGLHPNNEGQAILKDVFKGFLNTL